MSPSPSPKPPSKNPPCFSDIFRSQPGAPPAKFNTPPPQFSPPPAAQFNPPAFQYNASPVAQYNASPAAQFRASPAPQAAEDDEWAFTSALPPGSQVNPNEIMVMDSNLRVVAEVNRPIPDGPILLKAKFSSNSSQPIQDLTFQMAVTKVLPSSSSHSISSSTDRVIQAYSLKMEPQSGRFLQPHQKDGIVQIIRVAGAPVGGARGLKMRWKASYRVGTGPFNEEQGVIEGLPVA